MIRIFATWCIFLMPIVLGCTDADFSSTGVPGSGGENAEEKENKPPPQLEKSESVERDNGRKSEKERDNRANSDDEAEEGDAKPQGDSLEEAEENISISATPDYKACAAAGPGKWQNYKDEPRCPMNEVVIVVNDGTDAHMICCNIGSDVLTKDPARQYVPRSPACEQQEVAVGIQDGKTSTFLCSAVDDAVYETTTVSPSRRITKDDRDLPPDLLLLAKSAVAGDTCICPENHVVIGNHTYKDNICSEQCTQIISK